MKLLWKLLPKLTRWLLFFPLCGLMAETPEPPPRETTLYIPFEEFWKVFEAEDRGVFLPYGEFRRLWDAARAAGATAELPKGPEGVLLTEMSGAAEVTGEVARMEASLVLEALNPGWHEFALGLAGASLGRAALDGAPARMLGNGKEGYRLLFEQIEGQPTRRELNLEFTAAVVSTDGGAVKRFQFALPPAPVSRWEVLVPEPGLEIELEPRLATARSPDENPETETRMHVFLAATPGLNVRWVPQARGAQDLESIIQSAMTHRVELTRDLTRVVTEIRLNISRSPLDEIVLKLPLDERVVDVTSPELRTWTVTRAEDAQELRVAFLRPVRDQVSLRLQSEQYQQGATRRMPVVEVAGAVLSSGAFLIAAGPDLRVDVLRQEGVLRQSAPANQRYSFRYDTLPHTLELGIEAVRPAIQARHQVVGHIAPLSRELRVRSTLDIRRSSLFQIELDVPDGYDVHDLSGQPHAPEAHRLGPPENGRRILHVDFASPVQGELVLSYVLRQERREEALMRAGGGEVTFEIPIPRATGVEILSDEGQLLVAGPGYLSFRPIEAGALRPLERLSVPDAVFGYSYAAETPLLRVGARRRDPHVGVEQLLSARFEAGLARYTNTLHLQVRHSGVPSLRVDIPADLAERIQLAPAELRRTVLEDAPDLEPGMIAWLLERPGEFLGESTAILTWETPIEGLEPGVSLSIPIPRILPRGMDRLQSQAVFRKADSLDVSLSPDSEGMTPIDPRHDLLRRQTFPDAALAYELLGEWKLGIDLLRYEPASLRPTSIERGLVRMVRTRGGDVTTQALYRMRSTRQRLEIILPEETEFDTRPLRLNGRVVPLERGTGGRVFVPLTGITADEPFLLELRYSQGNSGGAVVIPHFVEEPASQELRLSVYIPENRVYLGQRGDWNPQFIWRVGKGFRLMPQSRQTSQALLAWVSEGVSVEVKNLDQLPVEGQHLLFTALQPDSSRPVLRLAGMDQRLFATLVMGFGLVLGLLLVRASLHLRLIAVSALLALWVLSAVFTPALARALVNDGTAGTAALVLILWIAWDLAVRLPAFLRKRDVARPAPVPAPAQVELESGDEI